MFFVSNFKSILVLWAPSFKKFIVSVFFVLTGTKPKLIKGSNWTKGWGKYAFNSNTNLKSFSLVIIILSNWSSFIVWSVSNITKISKCIPGAIWERLFFLSVSTLNIPFGCFIFTLLVFFDMLYIFTGTSYILFFSTSTVTKLIKYFTW